MSDLELEALRHLYFVVGELVNGHTSDVFDHLDDVIVAYEVATPHVYVKTPREVLDRLNYHDPGLD